MSYFSNDIVFPSEGEKDINTWADYCELFCLISEAKVLTIDQLEDRLLDQCHRDFKVAASHLSLTKTVTGSVILEMMADALEAEAEETRITEDVEEGDGLSRSDEAKYSDRLREEFRFLFDFLQTRALFYGDKYPFVIEGNTIRLLGERIFSQNIYLCLLLSAVFRIYTPGNRNYLGHLFEDLCGTVFKKLVPNNAVLHPFGAGAREREHATFTGTFFDKIVKLSELIHTDITTEFRNNEHDHQHVGDGGLDWVAWYNFSDTIKGKPLFFGQCACGEDWVDKEMDAHEDKWNNHLQFQDKYLLYHFISKSYRKSDGSWIKPGKINYGIVLLDRYRILENITTADSEVVLAPYRELLEDALSMRMPLVDIERHL